MPKRGIQEFLCDIVEAINSIGSYTDKMTSDDFFQDKKTQDAVVRNLEIIGEAVKNLPQAFRSEHQKIEWRKIAGLRDKVIHYYFGINLDVVWDVVKNKFPHLREQIKQIIKE
ncbi:hypothetical protein A2291_06640 [candidate division WOR-1 bacterium RIFOXYB2_FULL_42_35]|uniref:DUF86 domain-containing protein n=1 Tax=candidate division WOR-1 bacterium RIFOXYC2_FULL_41_25 TaxID=1802586 RepID=A0A1F4TRC7_UNCSA|nr:MAG: hypothetical protein A2291_06640 [candidate division WOR-1 bacterium RIFOXYB2_FULL_42_35]OGC24558.1 MAG: hypothetical protein A2247_06420 [candidate division WOR-1 bacterium RIFOXYA2_FULL_41_14]OGC34603.1 MAG: hypothetical protein A2462_04655 [candidate division WOR-1 bacterium RIFOXYC2_FULL_41_25]OGC43990.1 MAG: hypothetical protein A2548_06310 [candidate division WOR-1 bacterium RIFOXYD2_FULL_41_8]